MEKKSLTKISKRKSTTKTTPKNPETAAEKVSKGSKVRNKTAPTPKKTAAIKSTVKKKSGTTTGTTKGKTKTSATTKKTKPVVTKKSATAKAKPKKKKPVKITAKKRKTKPALHKPATARSTIRKTATPASQPALPRKPKVASLPVLQPPKTDKKTLSTTRIRGPIGVITHYYSDLRVAVVQLVAGALQIGDIIQIKGHTTDLIQTIVSLEVDHQNVDRTVMGQLFGMKVRDHVREHDQVFKITHG